MICENRQAVAALWDNLGFFHKSFSISVYALSICCLFSRQDEGSTNCMAEEVWSNADQGDGPGANNNYHQDKMYDNPPL